MHYRLLKNSSLVTLLVVSLGLSGCLFPKPAPAEVVERFTQAMTDTVSFHYNLDLNLSGRLPITVVPDVDNLSLKVSGDALTNDPSHPHFTLQTQVAGASPQGNLALAGELVNLDDYLYFRLTNLTLPTLLPISLGTDSRWYKIRHLATANPNEKKLGVTELPQFTTDQIQAMRQFIGQTTIAEVLEVLPDATVNGQRSYHYRVKLRSEAITELLDQINQTIDTDLGIADPVSIDRYQPEIWINKRTFRLSQLKLTDLYLQGGVPISFDLTLGLSRHNEQINITAPKDTEELTTDRLFQNNLPF